MEQLVVVRIHKHPITRAHPAKVLSANPRTTLVMMAKLTPRLEHYPHPMVHVFESLLGIAEAVVIHPTS